jgi:hypothetical protein
MKIKEADIRELSPILSALYNSELYDESEKNKGALFFPIEEEGEIKEETEEGVVLLHDMNRNKGSKSLIKPGLLLTDKGIVKLAYVSTEYAYDFNLRNFSLFMGKLDKFPLKKKEIDKLSAYECLLVKKEQVVITF